MRRFAIIASILFLLPSVAMAQPAVFKITGAAPAPITVVRTGDYLRMESGDLRVRSSGAAFDLRLGSDEALSADRLLKLNVGNAARVVTFSGNPTLGDWFDQAVKAASSPTFADLDLTGDADITGTLVAGQGVGEGFNLLHANSTRLSSTAAGLDVGGTMRFVGAFNLTLNTGSTSADRTYTFPNATGTFALTNNKLSAFANTTSAEFLGIITDETGSGLVVGNDTPTLITPVLGVASATSINKVAITSPATGSTLTIQDGFTLTVSGTSSINQNVTTTGTPSFTSVSATTFTGALTGNATTATALATSRNLWGQAFTGAADVTGSLTSVGSITGGASSMVITAGTGNSRDLTLRTTTSGGTATTALTLNTDQTATFAQKVTISTATNNSASNPFTSAAWLSLNNTDTTVGNFAPLTFGMSSGETAVISGSRSADDVVQLLFGFRSSTTAAWNEVMRMEDNVGQRRMLVGQTVVCGPNSNTSSLISNAVMEVQRASATAGDRALAVLSRAKGTIGTPTTVADGDGIGQFQFNAYDGTNFISSARVGSLVNGAVSSGVVPQDLLFFTGSTTSPTEWMRLTSLGKLAFTSSMKIQTNSLANGQSINFDSLTELTTIAAAATTTTTIQIPANAVVDGVCVRVTTAIPTATTFDYGVTGATTRYGTGISTAANTTSTGTADGSRPYAAAVGILITPNMTPAANTGRVRVTIFYHTITAPTSQNEGGKVRDLIHGRQPAWMSRREMAV